MKFNNSGYHMWHMDENIFVEKKRTEKNCAPHYHDYIEIIYVLRGQYIQTIDGNDYSMRHGDLLVVDYDQAHSYRTSPGSEYYNIFIKLGFFEDLQKDEKLKFSSVSDLTFFSEFKNNVDFDKRMITFSIEERTYIEALISLIEEELKRKATGYSQTVKSAAVVLFTQILRKMTTGKHNSEKHMFDIIIENIHEHYSEKLTLDMMADLCNYNKTYFSSLFKKNTGVSFTEYLKYVRVEKACELLKNTDINIDDLCYKVGYNNKTKFFQHFKSVTGYTPGKYRKADIPDIDIVCKYVHQRK